MSSELSCETSDEASENELLDRSLSVWRGWSAIEKEDFTPIPLDLHTACSIGQYDRVRSIISRNEGATTVDRKNKGGWTALMYACYIGHDNIVNLLVKAGCQMNKMKNPRGHTPLMLAASCGNENVARTLVRNGAELEEMDKSGWTALFHATYAGHQNFVAYLLEAGANINAVEPTTGLSPFMLAAAEGHEIIVQLFLQHGVNVHAKAYNGDMARSLALIKGYMKIVSLIDNHAMPASRLRSEPGLDFYLSSSDDDQPKQLRGLGVAGQKKSKGPSIRDGPEAIARMIDRTRPDDMSACTDMLTPKGYMSFSNTAEEKGGTTQLSYRDVTSPINPEDYKDTSGDGEDFEYDSNAFSKTGAITIKSSSSSSGGLVAALGLSREGSLDSDDSRGYDHQNTEEDSSDHLDSNPDTEANAEQRDNSFEADMKRGNDCSERKKLPLLKLPQPGEDEPKISSSSSSFDNLKEKPRAVVSPLRDYFPLDISFPPDVTGDRGTNGGHRQQHLLGTERSNVGGDFAGAILDQERHNIQSSHLREQYRPPRDSMSQSEIVQAYFNSMSAGGRVGDGGSSVSDLQAQPLTGINNDGRSLAAGSMQQQQNQKHGEVTNQRSDRAHNTGPNQIHNPNANTSTTAPSQNHPMENQRLRSDDRGSFVPIKDFNSDMETNARVRQTHFIPPQRTQNPQQQQQGNNQMSNQFPMNPSFPSSFPEDFGNQNSGISTSIQTSSSMQQEIMSTGIRTVTDSERNPRPSSQQSFGIVQPTTGNDGINFHSIPHHQFSIHTPPVSFQLPLSSPHGHYQQSNAYQNTAPHFVRHPPPDYYTHPHQQQQQQQQQQPLLPRPPSLPPPPHHHHYHHHHHHLQHHQQNPYNIYPHQHSMPPPPAPPPPPPPLQNFGHRQHHPILQQQQQQHEHQHPPVSSYPTSTYRNFPPDPSYPSHMSHPAFDPASYYKTIPSDIYYSDMSTISAFHFGSDTETKGNVENIPSNSHAIQDTSTTNNSLDSLTGYTNNNNDEVSEAAVKENTSIYDSSIQKFLSNEDSDLDCGVNKMLPDKFEMNPTKPDRNVSVIVSSSSVTTAEIVVTQVSSVKAAGSMKESSSLPNEDKHSLVSNASTPILSKSGTAAAATKGEAMENLSAFTSVMESKPAPSIPSTIPKLSHSSAAASSPSSSTPTITTTHPPISSNTSIGQASNAVICVSETHSVTPTTKTGVDSKHPTSEMIKGDTTSSSNNVPNLLSPVPNSIMIPGHTTSQPVSQSTGLLDQQPCEGVGCKDLREMLAQLGLSKYLEKFQEQDVDLQVFLSLTDNDLKEVGIKLFGPRKKMANAIARWHSQAPLPSNCLEQAYADRLEGEMQELAIQLNQAYASEERLKAQVLQEQQLRSVTESCLMDVRGHWEKTRQTVEEAQGTMKTIGDSLAKLRLNQKDIRKNMEDRLKSDTSFKEQQQHGKTGEENEGTPTARSQDGYSSIELVRKSEKYLKEMHKGLSSLAHNIDKVLTSTQDLSSLNKGLEEI